MVGFEDVWAIQQVKARYCRFLDTKDWPAWRELFHDDLVFRMPPWREETGDEPPLVVGADAFVEYVSRQLESTLTCHHVHSPEITLVGADRADVIWAMADFLDDVTNGRRVHGYGHYHERYVRAVGGDWQIAELTLTRLFVAVSEPSGAPGAPPPYAIWDRPGGAASTG
ncbi:MAG: nuclear transport factor 2 family protein [Ilumatobacteraceae bacterium]